MAALASPRDVTTEITVRATSAVIDVFIASTLIFMLSKSSHGEYQFKRSNTLVNRLIILTINTGLWTAAFAVVSLALMAGRPHSLNFCYAELPIGSIYINSLLGNLNARNFIRHTDIEFNSLRAPHGEHAAPSDELSVSSGAMAASSLQHANKPIRVDTARAIHVDTVDTLEAMKVEASSI
ncbi:hypothetical protein PsYK624_066730 [Phanerochaete sordida]|uniref:DUF6534 domain-containing protein n=1 Tax=Phanerochaete sordida TaxID=48140 RepID=A0A9P3G752_9APHY|nr:hypothetical protein PsYK624_066730 [Phanerochaete sordida]